MSETTHDVQQCPADLRALHRQLEEMAARNQGNSVGPQIRTQVAGAPVIVIRGK